MATNTLKCDHLTAPGLKGLRIELQKISHGLCGCNDWMIVGTGRCDAIFNMIIIVKSF